MEFTRRIYEDGKITVPKELRQLQNIREGDFVRIKLIEVIPGPRAPDDAPEAEGRRKRPVEEAG